ncbi:unnamed protein product [Rotaria sordida]|uniref:C2H2-type domain-containing protein n=1 Tax=Rotaria sordida TaxID=392033 RepID=A0A818PDC3_9BILA|nr:unnamed protein product [Rotaria sordida]CAF3622590.1 unnamed protein product [Rotaria sordida]
MDEFYKSYSIKNQDARIIFDDKSLKINDGYYNEHSGEEFVRYFSIDDDDIVRLDQTQIIYYDVKCTLNYLIDNIINQENTQCQITNLQHKRSLELNNDEYLSKKKVRFNISNDEQQSLKCLFVSENFQNKTQLRPYTKFLYNLGYDLCLNEYLNENNYLSESQKQILIKQNEVFYHNSLYSCKYCSFKSNTIHVMDYHYRTPHTLTHSIDHHRKYRCTYCSYQTFRLPELRRHLERKHGYILITEPSFHRYRCCYCSYETDEKNHFLKHNNRCQIDQERTRIANNLLQPFDQSNRNINQQITTMKTKSIENNKKKQTTNKSSSIFSSNTTEILNNNEINEINEPILIESDHDTSSLSRSPSSSDEDFIVSSDAESSTDEHDDDMNDLDFEIPSSRSKKSQKPTYKTTTSLISQSHSINPIPTTTTTTVTNLSSLSKLLLLNGTPITTFTASSINSIKPPLVPIQPKPTNGNDIYQMCNICQCYIYKKDYIKHMKEKHNNNNQTSPTQQTISTPLTILNNTANNINTSITCLTPTLIVTKTIPQPPTAIFLLSTSTMDPQSIKLDMIKCPWCDTNFEHIDIMTGHLMRYHRMTLSAAKVVVAEQMKIQGTSSSQLSFMFKQEIEQIQKEFSDKIYWKISQPKVYLHQVDNLSCFICKKNIDDIENHFISLHQIPLITMNKIKQCCLCGIHCNKNTSSLFEHQLRTHSGVCYSTILKQFIRFEPPPPPLSRTIISKDNNRLILPSSSSSSLNKRTLTTYTEKKFGCRKCDTSSRLFTFEELIEHLRLNHKLIVKLHRRCIICQQTYLKGKEYNQHCLEHLNDENPSIEIKRYYMK